MKILVLNDSKMGHLNQSLAFAKLTGSPYTVADVRYKNKFCKFLSYVFDRLYILSEMLYECDVPSDNFDYVVSAGSTCAYPLKVIAKKLNAKSVSMMLPKGYRYDYDVVFAQQHDNPPKAPNIIEIPANFSYVIPQGFFHTDRPSIGIVIGGNNSVFHFSKEHLKVQLDSIFEHFKGYRFAVTTSPRTAREIESLLDQYPFDYKVIYSLNPINPIPDFLDQCEQVFITQDSTSMISEAVSFGHASIEILPLESNGENKFSRLVKNLQAQGYVHTFDGTSARADKKIDFREYLRIAQL